MSITTYAELKTAITDWTHRSDLTSKLADFITLAESRINRQIRFNEQEIEVPLTASVGSRYIPIPAGFIRPISLWLTYYVTRDPLTWCPVHILPVDVSDGQPEYWTVDGSNIAFNSDCDLPYTFTLRYATTENLSDVNTSNWILANHPDVYLYASLIEAAGYIRDQELLATAKGAFDIAMAEVIDYQHRTKAKATLFTELSDRAKSDIYQG